MVWALLSPRYLKFSSPYLLSCACHFPVSETSIFPCELYTCAMTTGLACCCRRTCTVVAATPMLTCHTLADPFPTDRAHYRQTHPTFDPIPHEACVVAQQQQQNPSNTFPPILPEHTKDMRQAG